MVNKIIVLGSGTSINNYPSGYLLQINNKNYLIECSEGIRHRLQTLKIDYFDVDKIFISHFHPDHFNVETLIQSQMVRNYQEKINKSLTVYGPPEVGERFEKIWDAKHNPGHFKNKLSDFIKVSFIEYRGGQKINVDGFTLTPYEVIHGNMPAYALRFEIENKVFSYSGDTKECDGLNKACRNANIFICEANDKIGTNSSIGHLNAQQVGDLSAKNGVSNLILSHLSGTNSEIELVNAVKETRFKGELSVASDLDVIEL